VRVAAIEALSHLESPLATEALARAARSDDADVRRVALVGLGIARRPETLPLLLEAARGPDAATRLVAVSAMAGFHAPDVLDALADACRDADETVRTAAIGFLGARDTVEATLRLAELAAESGPSEQILGALARQSPGRVQGLVRALGAADDELAPILTAALARMHHPLARRALVDVLAASAPPARRAAAAAMAVIATPEMLEALRAAVENDPDLEVRRVCAASLSR
jgi:HEAT repeat protein